MENRDWLTEVTGEHAKSFIFYDAEILENQYLSTIPHSTYHYDICILHIVKAYQQQPLNNKF